MNSKIEYAAVLKDSRLAFDKGKSKDIEWRRNQLQQLLRLVEENENVLAEVLEKDLRKPYQESVSMEVEFVANIVRTALANLDQWVSDEYVEKNLLTLLDTTYIHRDALGVVLIIGPWNYPVQLCLAPLVGAIAAGNAVILKPSELAPHSAELMQKLIEKYLDKELIKCICGGVPETTELLKLRFDHIFYTGSTHVGKIVAAAAAKHLTPCTLELGGKSPVYLDSDVDMHYAAKRIVWGKMICMGQTCVAPDYILCTEEVREKFVEKVKVVYRDFFGEDAANSPDLTRILNDRNFERLQNLYKKSGGKTVFGGRFIADQRFMDLTVVQDVKLDDSLMSEELFGPILPIVTVQNEHEAAAIIKTMEKPLSLYIFSRNKKVQDTLIENTSSGSVCVNDVIVHLSVETLPFGGVGESGNGSYHGFYTYKTFSHEKSVCKRDFSHMGEILGLMRYAPYSQNKIDWGKRLLRSRKLPFSLAIFLNLGLLALGYGIGSGFFNYLYSNLQRKFL